MPEQDLIDETFDINSSLNYELTMQISTAGFAYCILDTIRNRYVLLRSRDPDENKAMTAEKTEEIIISDSFLSARFKKTNLILPSAKSTLVPSPLFDPLKKEEYFSLNLVKDENEIILYNKITDPDAFVIFSVPEWLTDLTGRYFPSVKPCHHATSLIDQAMHLSRDEAGQLVLVHLERDYFNLLVLERGSLKFYNTFVYKNMNDIMYYLFNVCKTLGVKREENVWFSGLTSSHDELSSRVQEYLRNIKFMIPSGNFSFSYIFNSFEVHRYLSLFGISRCGL
ncbi:MAG TPA: DUF3822 family protein [Bacteroidales bacterium]|jgi:hypothetical protein|nr:DUF3822 family protein [Bacteroidales bacterium]HQH23641.1 DUF3822 family protein [Bacteroidales bacterium]HQJ81163.1 DUF3822 family protein [Bacteroidales bacterium]